MIRETAWRTPFASLGAGRMPETIRTTNERLRSRPRRGGFLAAFVIANLGIAAATPALAMARSPFDAVGDAYRATIHASQNAASLTLTLALVCFAILALLVLLQTRRRAHQIAAASGDDIASLRTEIDRLKALLLSEPQVLIEWPAASDQPAILGDTRLMLPGSHPERILAFGTWLDPMAAQRMERAVDTLRNEGRGFVMTLTTLAGRPVEAEGRAVAGRAILRLRDVSGIERELIELAKQHDRLQSDVSAMTGLLDSLPTPVWARDPQGRLSFVNAAYASAVEAGDANDAVTRQLELLDPAAREEVARVRAAGKSYAARIAAIAAGQRRIFDLTVDPSGAGSAGIAIDRTEVEIMRAEHARMVEAHRRVLDQLATGVAIFDGDRKLIFYNAAFCSLFELLPEFLDQTPTDNAVLDALRSKRKLPEEQDFRQWKNQLHEAYRAVEPQEHIWYLPDGRTLRVVTTPNPEGGVTYLYDDVTERLDLHRRYDAMIKVQSETLDHLAEAVAVFGSDGRVRLHNPAFERMWKLTAEALDQRPHIIEVTAWCQALHDDNAVWRDLRGAVTAIEEREPLVARIERRDGFVIDLTTMPLPDGATLVTFQDVSDTVNVERALRERNEALETADRIKIDVVQHVSYELRSPLTNIVGFAHFLGDQSFGPLTEKQREYLGYITTSTNALLAIINNILDLATIDAGAMTLNLGEVDIRASMEAAAEGVQDRLVTDNLTLDIRAPSGIGSITADERRLRQVLFNLLSNAIGFSPPGGIITLTATRQSDAVVFAVTDQGPGIPAEAKDKVFDWFESDPRGSRHRGPGLGLSLVRSFVELHGGTARIDSRGGHGTTVTCTFPIRRAKKQSAA
jgi:signal transduction histidine kinase